MPGETHQCAKIGLKYLCSAEPAASWSPCLMGLTCLSALTVTPAQHIENITQLTPSIFFLGFTCVKLMCPPWWMHFSQEHHHWSVAGLQRCMMLPVLPHRLIWTLIAERRKTEEEVFLLQNSSTILCYFPNLFKLSKKTESFVCLLFCS